MGRTEKVLACFMGIIRRLAYIRGHLLEWTHIFGHYRLISGVALGLGVSVSGAVGCGLDV